MPTFLSTDIPQLYHSRVIVCFWESYWNIFCLSSKRMSEWLFSFNLTKFAYKLFPSEVCDIHFMISPQVLPIVVFFSSVMSVLYFLGIMQWLILKVKKQQNKSTSRPSVFL